MLFTWTVFEEYENFDQPLDNWNVSNVKDMKYMFYDTNYNQPLNNLNVSNVKI